MEKTGMKQNLFFSAAAALAAMLFTAECVGADKLVFSCDFSNQFQAQTCAQPCHIYPKDVKIVDVPGGKAIRFGKTNNDIGMSRISYKVKDAAGLARKRESEQPFPMRYGRLEFKFRPVDWKLGEPPFNMMLMLKGPRQTNLHITYTRPSSTGLPSIQAAYGQFGNKRVGKGQLNSLFPYVELDPKREWHDVKFEWNPAMLKLTVDGKERMLSTANLSYPTEDFYATQLIIGADALSRLRGQTDLRDLKIYSTLPDPVKKQTAALRFPEVTIVPVNKPVIDGKITKGEWDSCVLLRGFAMLPRAVFAPHQPVVRMGYDQEKLYIAIISSGHKSALKSTLTQRDSNLWLDDNFEIHLDPTPDTPDYFQFIINPAGVVFDQHARPGMAETECVRWNCPGLKAVSRFSGNQWVLEAEIPFSGLNAARPAPGSSWLFNICETLSGTGLYAIAGVQHSYAEHDKYGVLKFGSKNASVINMESFGDLGQGKADFRFGADRIRNGKVEISAFRYDETAHTEFPLFSLANPLSNQVKRVFTAGVDKLGKNGVLYVNCYSGADKIYAGRFCYEISDEAEIEFLRRIRKADKNFLKVQSAQAVADGYILLFDIRDGKNQVVRQHRAKVDSPRQDTLIPLDGIPEGNYTIGLQLKDSVGRTLKTAEARPFTVYGKVLPWTGCKLGIANHVPKPWTPLNVEKVQDQIRVSCWNRTYTFGTKSLFIEQIQSGNSRYLAKPVRLRFRSGELKQVEHIRTKLISQSNRSVVIETSGKIPGWGTVRTTATVEYDGFIWYDLDLNTGKAGKLDELAIEFEMPHARSALLNSGFRTLVYTGNTPEQWSKKLDDMFGPFWIGDEDGGISFGIESVEFWNNQDPGNQATVVRKSGNAKIALHPVDSPMTVKKNVKYGFYIHPTPVRPRPARMHTLRSLDWFGHNREVSRGNTYPTNFSWWMTGFYYQGTPDWVTDRNELKEHYTKRSLRYRPYYYYDNLNRKQTRSAWYAAYSSIGRNSPPAIWCGESWRAGNTDKLYGNTLYGFYDDMIEVCKTPEYSDYYLWQLDHSRKKSPVIDGIYFDLMFWPACTRIDHNHGYVGKDGKRYPTWTVREHRRWLERVYIYCHENAQDAPVVTHISGATSRVAGFSFADYFVDGELWCNVLVQDRSYKNMKLDQLRAEILPSIYGPGFIWISQLHRLLPFVPATQRKSWRIDPWARRHIAGMLLIHEVLPDGSSLSDIAWNTWRALDLFGFAEDDVILPYWKKSTGISGDSDGKHVAVTGFLKKNKKLLLIVLNNQDRDSGIRIKLDMMKLFGRNVPVSVFDLEQKKELYRGKADFSIPVTIRNFRLLEVRPQK